MNSSNVTLESIVLVSLLHDCHKINCYEQIEKSVFKGYDEAGKKIWAQEKVYQMRDDRFTFGLDGSNSNYIIG